MSEYWKSTPRYWCKHCSTFVRETGLERANHESTAKHQGAIKRSLRDLHRNADQKERDKERAKREVERLNGVVSGSRSGSGSGSHAPRPGTQPSGAPPQKQSAEAERQTQLEQLAELGVNIPTELRGTMAMVGEWTVTSTRVIEKPDEMADSKDLESSEGRATGVKPGRWSGPKRKREAAGQEGAGQGDAAAAAKPEPLPPIKKEPDEEETGLAVISTEETVSDLPSGVAATTIEQGLIPSLKDYLKQRNREYKALYRDWLNGTNDCQYAPATWPAGRCLLTSLPAELLLMICGPLYQADLVHLALTCRALAGASLHLVYQRDVSDFDCLALRWACTFGIEAQFAETPLSTAILATEPEIVRLLLAQGADVHSTTVSGLGYNHRTDLFFPINLAMGTPDMPPFHGFQPGHPQIVRHLLDAGADPNQHNIHQVPPGFDAPPGPATFTPLLMAMQAEIPVETVKLLLERGADPTLRAAHEFSRPSSTDLTPPLCRLWNHPQTVDILRLFIVYGADINTWAENGIPPTLSVILWAEEIIQSCRSIGARHKISPAIKKVLEVVTLMAEATLVEATAGPVRKSSIIDAGVTSSRGQTALRYVCGPFRLADSASLIIPILLRYGADMNNPDHQSRTALHRASLFAASGDRVQPLVEFLGGPANSGLVVDALDSRGWTPLHYTCLFGLWGEPGGQVAAARLLLEKGADIRARTKQGWTPLSLAVFSANKDLVELLLDHGSHLQDLFFSFGQDSEPTLVPVGRIIFVFGSRPNWLDPLPPPAAELASLKTSIATLLGDRMGIPIPLPPVPEDPVLPLADMPWNTALAVARPPPTLRIDVVDHPFRMSCVGATDATARTLEEGIEGVLNALDRLCLTGWIGAVGDPDRPSILWRDYPPHTTNS
ncbi:ankyrin repeat-containing domain protein [Chaetomidium leptoderma]|uniref:Ankyrin repeat-containing domain protein n=1 Tax=Chaetomidium leptoderma TaxID=669021 RepID=A0AAN6VRP6_9PEZI|nr:ankyrin repeat-containing domain protein [Chaetomidium leptoderma]